MQKCTLNLHQTYSKNKFDIPGIVSKPETPGLILAHGRVGESLYNGVQARVFISRDGGISWKQVCTACITAEMFNILKGYANTCIVLWDFIGQNTSWVRKYCSMGFHLLILFPIAIMESGLLNMCFVACNTGYPECNAIDSQGCVKTAGL